MATLDLTTLGTALPGPVSDHSKALYKLLRDVHDTTLVSQISFSLRDWRHVPKDDVIRHAFETARFLYLTIYPRIPRLRYMVEKMGMEKPSEQDMIRRWHTELLLYLETNGPIRSLFDDNPTLLQGCIKSILMLQALEYRISM
ncbi:hypothetical protein VC83_04218 [Pseudogymnoascus destructans]|uniref:Uncharacterized protein n=1 Tax=Pseudogymnoascus destructans TaxID=655981 RepID=A0A177ADQ3_9PEZI|nr:uncharacterized protein VC83_04218 [Pseudogymnoascus destructans]OAF59401.1 hypothetical protein VC83_04218 [Pseudogymnoascus destructans]